MKKKFLLPTILLSTLVLTSCAGYPSDSSATESSSSSSSSSLSSNEEKTGYRKLELTDTLADNTEYGVFEKSSQCPTTGNPDILVIPLYFADMTNGFTSSQIAKIEEAYTSTDLEAKGAFPSLREYYYESSYGKLDFDITIAEPYQCNYTCDELNADHNRVIPNIMYEYFLSLPEDISSQYDSDNDGYVDSIHLIYQTNYSVGSGMPWWHWTSAIYPTGTSGLDAEPCTFFFSGYVGLEDTYGSIPDTHTIIHECGHSLGLPDFYDYSYSACPAGIVDMMDYNIGDHGPFNKMLLGWTDPYIVDGSKNDFEITLRPFYSTGDTLVIYPDDFYNGSPMDEYLVFSYYVPEGISGIDSEGYGGMKFLGYDEKGGTYSTYGLQGFHVDARVAYREESSNGKYTYHYYESTSDWVLHRDDFFYMLASNTPAYTYSIEGTSLTNGNGYNLIEAISADGVDYFSDLRTALDNFNKPSILFQEGDTLGESTVSDRFNNDGYLNWDFEIVEMDENGITLHFSML